MKENQLSKFDCRLIKFAEELKLKVRYSDVTDCDVVIYRDKRFQINNNKQVELVRDENKKPSLKVTKGDQVRFYTLEFLINFVHYGNCDKCYCECQEEEGYEYQVIRNE